MMNWILEGLDSYVMGFGVESPKFWGYFVVVSIVSRVLC